jgi:fructokinase
VVSPKIVSFGETLWDLFPDGEQFGGAPANFACHAAIHGADVAMVSAVGNDRHGRDACNILQEFGIGISLMQTVPDAPTGTVGVTLDAAGKPSFTIDENAAWDRITWTDEIGARVERADAVYFGTLGQRSSESRRTIRRGIQTARDAGVPSIVDINLRRPFFDSTLIRESIDLTGILKLSDDELPIVISACGIESGAPVETQLRGLLESFNLDLVVMTRGAEGAILATADGIVEQQGIPTNVKDTVGAGDAFAAAFLLGVLRRASHHEVLHTACEIAAAACSHAGAVPESWADATTHNLDNGQLPSADKT